MSYKGKLFDEELLVEGEEWANIIWASVLFASFKNLSHDPLFSLLWDGISISFGVLGLVSLTVEDFISSALWFSI